MALPLPEPLLVMDSHAALLTAVHGQPLVVVIVAFAVPPSPAMLCVVGATV